MKFIFRTILCSLLLLIVTNLPALACTTFCLKNKNEVLFGKNYDWMIGDGMIFVNKRGMSKKGADKANAAKWTSKFGSVTFNQYGRENPSGGMNEAGLTIELMWLDETVYPGADSRPTLDVLEWIQYNLDNFSTLDEVIKNAEMTRVVSQVKLHYLVNDAQGNTATIEFLDGKFAPHAGETLPIPTLANDTYSKSLEFSRGTDASKAIGGGSLQRFTRAATKTRDFSAKERGEKEAVEYAFQTLADVAQPGYTQWSIVYDQKRRNIYYRTAQNLQIRRIDTKSFDYNCGSPVKMLDIQTGSGDITATFTNYEGKANRDLLERSFKGTPFLKDVPTLIKDGLAAHADSFACAASVREFSNPRPSTRIGEFIQNLLVEVGLTTA